MPSAASGHPLERSAAGHRNPWLVAVVVSMATFMEVLDTSVANVSLPHIAGNLAATQDESTWVLTSYLVSNAIVLPISGWLATVIGRKRFYLSCVALFGVSSFLCGLAPSLGMLVFFRVLQGIGGGGLAPTEQSILADMFPPEKRGQAFALYGIAVVVAPTLGPTLGGWITDNFTWRWIFLINVPVCLASLFLAGRMLVDPPAVQRDRERALHGGLKIDYLGFALVALGLGCLQVVLDKGQEDDWFASPFILVFAIVAGLSLLFLVVWELAQEHPIIDLSLMKNRNFAASMVVMFVTGFILIGTTQVIPRFLQTILGYSAMQAGLALTAGGCATLLVMPLVGSLTSKVPAKYLIVIGLVIECFACFHLSGINTEINFGHMAMARVFQAVGLPFLFVPISAIAYAGIPAGKNDDASALINTMRNLGGSFGISFATTLLAQRGQFHHSRLAESVSGYAPAWQHQPMDAWGEIAQRVTRQATMLSYIDIFWLLGWMAALAIPITFILRRPPPHGAPAAH
ncbi:DHA2 family efflux MFS transporter permease subunit [Horticoccus luteus]|uniref:DHA2 family efflux MFS transporter permease subunit n=1 Tax=Horticoccus luteus TaxID=2862869 RepID=A0A8F9TWM0_9BACT|nr:DHA2 family efflux MFS transporter permease subunit [Horticoccus luteus]QYM78902.1 DHA2 family efflux MFS transporter permease subunit [Horticoccus luteus]